MKIINLSEGNSLLNQYVAELRDIHVQNDRMRFRRNIERIGEIMAYEMSKALTYSVKQVQTPLGTATASTHDVYWLLPEDMGRLFLLRIPMDILQYMDMC